jgi:hypothetical protein
VKKVLLGATAVLAVLFLLSMPFCTGAGRTMQVRIDSGQIRDCWLGIPWKTRSKGDEGLLSVAAMPPPIPAEWHTVDWGPRETHGSLANGLPYAYYAASAWVAADRQIARFVLEDLRRMVERLEIRDLDGAVACYPDTILSPSVVAHRVGALQIAPDWRTDPDVLLYCREKGHEPPPAANGQPDAGG